MLNVKSIEKAKERGASDDIILSEIAKQNPKLASSIQEAMARGADSSAILEQIKKQASTQKTGTKKEEPKRSILRKVGDFFTKSTQSFGETLGTALSAIDPVTRKTREQTLQSAQEQVDKYMQMAKEEKDKERKASLLEAAQKLADTEDVDIFNNPEYQKTAKQVYGEAIGSAAETLGWGKVGNLIKGVRMSTTGAAALRGATTGGVLGSTFGVSGAMQEDADSGEITRAGITGGVGGAVLGGAVGAISGRLAGRASNREMAKIITGKITPTKRARLYKSGNLKESSFFKNEKYIPNEKDLRLGKLARDVGVRGKSASKDILKVNNAIVDEATRLKSTLRNTGAIYNKNNIKGALNKMKDDKIVDLIPAEERVYDKMIGKFSKMVDNKQNKKLDGLLELRQEFDKWALSNDPNIFNKKTGGSYRALISVRDTINNYINTKVKNDVVRDSLNKQHNLYTILDNISETVTGEQLKRAGFIKPVKQLLKWAGIAGGGYLMFGRRGAGAGSGTQFIGGMD